MKLSEGMSDWLLTVLALVFSALATICLNMGLRRGLLVGASYAVWIGLGVGGTAVADILFFDASMPIVTTCTHEPKWERIVDGRYHWCAHYSLVEQPRFTVPAPDGGEGGEQ